MRFSPRVIARWLLLVLVIGSGWYVYNHRVNTSNIYLFEGLIGPAAATVVLAQQATDWSKYDHGSSGRLAILLTDPNSAWLGLAHGLKSIGVPFRITRDTNEAVKHKAVLVYPFISGRVLTAAELQVLKQFASDGGTLIGADVLGGGMNQVFGFEEAVSGKHAEVKFDILQPPAAPFSDVKESVIRIANSAQPETIVGSYGYSKPSSAPLAVFEDGSAAITQNAYGKGHTYALGMDFGFLLLKGYNNREEGVARSYVNDFEPSLDVLLRLIKNLYLAADRSAVILATVPFGKSLSVVISHDIDYTRSLKNSAVYAEFEKSKNINATYFVQTKYVKDWNDEVFFNAESVPYLKQLNSLGMEVASHTVSHSRVMSKFPLGTGDETYPEYQPFVKDKLKTINATVLGELRVSKFLIDNFVNDGHVVSFRPGHLQNPFVLPQALQATGYRYSSAVTANNSLTHLPFQMNYNRDTQAEMDVFEFPVTVEDEALPKMGDRLGDAIDLSKKISRYGGSFVVLIHPDILDHKLDFERGFVEAVKDYSWFGSMREFGDWWSARNGIEMDVEHEGQLVKLTLPRKIKGLTLSVPAGMRFVAADSASASVTQAGSNVMIDAAEGVLQLTFKAVP